MGAQTFLPNGLAFAQVSLSFKEALGSGSQTHQLPLSLSALTFSDRRTTANNRRTRRTQARRPQATDRRATSLSLSLSALPLSNRPACDLPLSLCPPACDLPLSDPPACDLPLSLPSLFPTGEPPRRPSGSASSPDSSVPYSLSLLASLSALPFFDSELPCDRRTTAPPPLRLQIRHRLVQDVAVKVFSMQEYSKELINSFRQERNTAKLDWRRRFHMALDV